MTINGIKILEMGNNYFPMRAEYNGKTYFFATWWMTEGGAVFRLETEERKTVYGVECAESSIEISKADILREVAKKEG